MPAEIELKLTLGRSAVPRAAWLTRHPAVAAAKRGRTRIARVVSTYYDTPDFRLERAGVALRVRREGARYVQAVKGPPIAGAGGGLHARDEHEWRLATPRLDPERLAATPWRRTFAKALRHGDLAPLFTTDVTRSTTSLAFADGTTALLTIDVGSIRARRPDGRRAPIAEIEIEIEEGSAAPAFLLAQALVDDWPISIATRSKGERGYALVRGEPDGWRQPVRATGTEFSPDDPAEAALRSIAFGCLEHVAGNAAGLIVDGDPEWVHQMRIGTRRLRSCLSLVTSMTGAARIAPAVAELRWLARVLGAARDWDVLATETLPPLAAGFAHDAAAAGGLRRLKSRVARHRSAARTAAREAVASLRFQRLLLSVGAICAAPGFGARQRNTVSARDFAAALLTRRHRKLLSRGAALEHGTPEERHGVRIAAKKLRYAAEFFSPRDPGKRNRAYLKSLSRLQDALGRWNDAVIATRLTAGLAGTSDHVTVGAVRGWAAAHAAALQSEIERAWHRFSAAAPFWTRG